MAAPLILANVGLPILFFALPVAFYLLAPVIAAKTWIAQKKIIELSPARRLVGIVLATVISAVVGWPLAWAIFATLHELAIPGGGEGHGLFAALESMAAGALQRAWLVLYEDAFSWMVPASAIIIMVPAFVVTVLIEGIVLKLAWRKISPSKRNRFVLSANLYSYGLALALIWLLYLTASIALSIAIVIAVFCMAWTVGHRPREQALGATREEQAKMREHLVGDIRANSQYCSWYITLTGVIATMIVSHQEDFRVILNQNYLWPFGLSFLAATVASVFLPAGYGQERFKTLRMVWFRSVLCEQTVVIFTCYGVCSAFIALTNGQGLP